MQCVRLLNGIILWRCEEGETDSQPVYYLPNMVQCIAEKYCSLRKSHIQIFILGLYLEHLYVVQQRPSNDAKAKI